MEMRFSLKTFLIFVTIIAILVWNVGKPKIYRWTGTNIVVYVFSPKILCPNFTYNTKPELIIFFPDNSKDWGDVCTISKYGVDWNKGFSLLHGPQLSGFGISHREMIQKKWDKEWGNDL